MFKVVKNDFMRNFFSPYIWCCIISVCALHYLNVLAESSSGITPDYEELVFYLDGGFSVVDWIICVIGGGIGFCDEMKSGYFKFNLARIDKSSYCFSKVLNAAISSFLCAFMGLELFHGIYYVFCLCTQHSSEIQQITLSKVCSYHAMIFGIALLCGILSMFGLIVTMIIQDTFVSMTLPVLGLYLYMYASTIFGFPDFLAPSRVFYYTTPWGRLYSVFVTLWVGIGCYVFMKKKMSRRLEHE